MGGVWFCKCFAIAAIAITCTNAAALTHSTRLSLPIWQKDYWIGISDARSRSGD